VKHDSLGDQIKSLEPKIKTVERQPPSEAPKTVAELKRRQREKTHGG
jgi:uncharacterized protein YdcH (DUF465 family)